MNSGLLPPYVFGAKTAGRGHQIKKIPCQDAFYSDFYQSSHVIIAVADGLGSASRSDLGAQIAVESAVNAVTSLMAQGETDNRQLLYDGIRQARNDLFKRAAEEICQVRELASTILLIIASRDGIAVAHIGDGAIVIKGSGFVRVISPPENSEYANVVVPLTSDEWEKALRVYESAEPIECVAAFTDGLQNAALKKVNSVYEPFVAFFNPVFSYALKIEDTDTAGRDLSELLISPKVRDSSDDDKTLVIAVLNNQIEEEIT
jgi:L-aminopeptidase/D-esterase-like protein